MSTTESHNAHLDDGAFPDGRGGSDGMRMILMGPPGAGVYSLARKEVWARLGAK